MKKRLLITSIVMMLVVAVALSTATYAWFTSNASVTASTVTLTAATNDAEALGIGWLGGDASNAISNTVEGTLSPMAPAALNVVDTAGTGTDSTVTFYTASIRQAGSVNVFNKTGESVATETPKYFQSESNVQAFYIKNLSPSHDITKVTVSAVFNDVANDGDDMVRVAIFTKNAYSGSTTDETSYKLLGVLGKTATSYTQVTENTNSEDDRAYDRNTTYYTKSGDVYTQVSITEFAADTTYYTASNTVAYGAAGKFNDGAAVKDLDHYLNVSTSLDIVTNRAATPSYELAAGYRVDIVAVVWLDGTLLTDDRGDDVGSVTLSFNAI